MTSVVLRTVSAAATAVLIDDSLVKGRSLGINLALCSSDLAGVQARRLDEIEMYVHAILGSKMGNIPGLPGLGRIHVCCVAYGLNYYLENQIALNKVSTRTSSNLS